MKLELKEEYLDSIIRHPMTGMMIVLRFLDESEYKLIYSKGCEILFNVIEEVVEKFEKTKPIK